MFYPKRVKCGNCNVMVPTAVLCGNCGRVLPLTPEKVNLILQEVKMSAPEVYHGEDGG